MKKKTGKPRLLRGGAVVKSKMEKEMEYTLSLYDNLFSSISDLYPKEIETKKDPFMYSNVNVKGMNMKIPTGFDHLIEPPSKEEVKQIVEHAVEDSIPLSSCCDAEPPPGVDPDSFEGSLCEKSDFDEWSSDELFLYRDMKSAMFRTGCSKLCLTLYLLATVPILVFVLGVIGLPLVYKATACLSAEVAAGWTSCTASWNPGWSFNKLCLLIPFTLFWLFAKLFPLFMWICIAVAGLGWWGELLSKITSQLRRNKTAVKELDEELWKSSQKENSHFDYEKYGLRKDRGIVNKTAEELETVLGKELAEEYKKIKAVA